jgi:hypothetical protein
VAYTTNNKRITFTIPAATGRAFSATANFYTTTADANNVSTVLNTKLAGAGITNTAEPTYTIKTSAAPTVSAVAATMTIYFILQQDFVAASDLGDAITGAAGGDLAIAAGDGSVTGDIITALTIPGVTGTVTAVYATATHGITITISPVSNKAFNTVANTYSSVAAALGTKLGTVTNAVDSTYTQAGTPSATVTGGNLVVTIGLEE